ncbi:hypothetical protein JZ751_005154, partial [Albula glossodonta]
VPLTRLSLETCFVRLSSVVIAHECIKHESQQICGMEVLKILFSLAVLQVVCDVWGTEGFLDLSDLLSPVAHTDDYRPLDHFRGKREANPMFLQYIIDIEVNVSDISVVEQLRFLQGNVQFPFELNSMIEITDVNFTTVCNPDGSGFQCRCEEDFAWPLGNCNTYGNCSDIIDDTCGCINDIPPTGPFCQPKPPSIEISQYIIDIEVNVTDISVVDQLKFLLGNVQFPLQLNSMTEITDFASQMEVDSSADVRKTLPGHWATATRMETAVTSLTTHVDASMTFHQLDPSVNQNHYIIDIEVNVSDISVVDQLKFLLGNVQFPLELNSMIEITDVNLTTASLDFFEYIIDIEVNVSDISVVDQLKFLLGNVQFPLELNSMIEITDVNLTTVCFPDGSGFQCRCEEDFAWPLGNCNTYGNCSDIIDDTCGCINDIPPTGPFCQPKPPSLDFFAYIIDIEVNVSDISVVDQLKFLLGNIQFPLELNSMTEITDVNLTTVCFPDGSGFQCRCEEDFAWTLGNCNTYGNCSDIIDDTCGCINDIPPTGPFCQPKPLSLDFFEYIIAIEVNVSDISVVDQLKFLLGNVQFPLELNSMTEITDVNLTTVCFPDGSGFQCRCEEDFAWPLGNCNTCDYYTKSDNDASINTK